MKGKGVCEIFQIEFCSQACGVALDSKGAAQQPYSQPQFRPFTQLAGAPFLAKSLHVNKAMRCKSERSQLTPST